MNKQELAIKADKVLNKLCKDEQRDRCDAQAKVQPKGTPVAWSRQQLIHDDAGYSIGTDEPELHWGKEPPDDEAGWHPLYAAAGVTTRDAALEEAAQLCELWNTTPGKKLAKEIRALATQAPAVPHGKEQAESAMEDVYARLESLSKCLEGSGRIDEHDMPDAYATLLDAMKLLQQLDGAENSVAVYMAERNQARDRVLQLRAELGARAPVMATAVKTIEPVGFVDFPNVAAKVKTLDQLYTSLPEHTAVMRAAAEAIESLLSLIRRNAPELSGKVIGWAERDLAALRAALGTFDVPVQHTALQQGEN